MGMSTKQYLSQIERLDRMIQNKLSDICNLKHMATSITRVAKEVSVQTTLGQDRLGDAVSKIVDLENETGRLVDEYIGKRKRIIEQIDGIKDSNMYHILSERYIARKDWNVICAEMGYTFRNVMYLHGNALKEFENLYGNEYLS